MTHGLGYVFLAKHVIQSLSRTASETHKRPFYNSYIWKNIDRNLPSLAWVYVVRSSYTKNSTGAEVPQRLFSYRHSDQLAALLAMDTLWSKHEITVLHNNLD